MKKIIPILFFVLAMATSSQGGIVVLDYGSAGGDNETMINRLIDADHADDNATGAGTRTDQSVTPAGLKSTIGVLFPGIDPSLTNESVVCVNATGKIGDCSNLTWDGNEMGLNGGILLGGKARIASGENYIVRIADGANASGLKWYYFLTDATNYQYGYLSAGSDYVKVSADSNGTGADNIDVLLSPKGTGVIGNADKSFQVDADGDLTAKSVSVTRGDWPGFMIIYEPTSGGDDYWKWKTSDNQMGPVVNITPLDVCSAGQVLKVASVDGDNQTWECAALAGGGTMTSVKVGSDLVGADDMTAINFGAGFDVADNETIAEVTFDPSEVTVTRYQFFPAAYIEEIGTGPEDAALIPGHEVKARSYSDNDTSIITWQVDPDYSAGIKYRVYYVLAANAEADNTVSYRMAGCSAGNQDAIECTVGATIGLDDELGTDDDGNETMITGWSEAVSVTDIAAGELARLSFYRGTDDYTGEVLVVGVEIKYQAKLAAASSDY